MAVHAGEQNLLEEDIGAVASQHPDGSFASQDLYEAIQANNFPEWHFFIQTMPYADQLRCNFDPLDATKVGAPAIGCVMQKLFCSWHPAIHISMSGRPLNM